MLKRHNFLSSYQASPALPNSVKSFCRKNVLSATIIGLMGLTAAQTSFAAPDVAPRLKPVAPALSNFLSDEEALSLRKAISAANRDDWLEFELYKRSVDDKVARNLLTWIRASQDRSAPFETLTEAAQELSDWPRQITIRARAESEMFDNPLSPKEAIDWFKGEAPVSGEGRAALARAHYARGNDETADMWLRSAWRDAKLTRSRQQELFSEFRPKLTPEDHARRADHLIWNGRWYLDSAQALLPFMDRDERNLMDARIRVAADRAGMDAAIDAVPSNYQSDSGLLYERAKWRRRKRSKDYALPLLQEIPGAPINDEGKASIWRERQIMAYWLISEKRFPEAYNIVLGHGFEDGADFAEAEFLAGWLALRKLGNAEQAQIHFRRLAEAVSTPISLARGYYWLGRAQTGAEADASFFEASKYPNTFYGQLASLEVGKGSAILTLPPETLSESVMEDLKKDERVKAMQLLGEIGEERLFSQIAFHLDDTLGTLPELSALATLAENYGYMRPSVRAAKQASRFQTMLTESGYPRVPIIEALPNQFETAFVYAIARQETEFETNAISSAQAYGLMQMIDSTARYTARKHNVPYSQTRLLSDAEYSAQLGAYHLNDLLERWDGSYILAAVSYNAGPHRAKQWIETYGDPRSGEIDPIDWIESTPFSETRNYVQRVLENMQVYRARLNGNSAPLYLERDLRQGQQ
jgi:soluble lytic murein transglycosylase